MYEFPVKKEPVPPPSPPGADYRCRMYAAGLIGVRAGGGEGGCSPPPPKFGQLRFFGQQEKIWAKPVFKDVSMFFIIIIVLKR